MSEANKAVFLSYASQDANAAKRICDALRAAGVEVWFDQNELVGGDQWDQKIRRQIKDCALFLPIVSARTEERSEGYFRREWKLAVDRTHDMAGGRSFIVPVVIDDTKEAEAAVPEEFMRYQWTRLPNGGTPPEFAAQVKRLLEPRKPALKPQLPRPPTLPPEFRQAAKIRAAEATAATQKSGRRGWIWAALAVLVLGGVAGFFALRNLEEAVKSSPSIVTTTPPAAKAAPELPRDKSVAVLAFANLSDDKANEYFSDGISEELLNVLAKVPGLKVSARTSAFYFKGKEVPIPEIAKQLGVAYVVEGSVRKQGDKVRITAQLIKADGGFHVWSDTFTRDLKDIFAVQDEIAGLIARNLSLKLGTTRATRVVDPEAHRLVLEGRYHWNLRTSEGLAHAEVAFGRAIEIDPDFAEAHAGLADVRWVRTVYACFAGQNFSASLQPLSQTNRALELDPELAEAYPSIGGALDWTGRKAEAEQMFQKAIALNPNYALAHHWHGLLLEKQGKLDEALGKIDRAIQLDPLSAAAYATRLRLLFMAGRVSEALAVSEKAWELRRGLLFSTGIQAQALLAAGRKDEALAEARSITANPSFELRYVSDAAAIYVLRKLGHEAEAVAHVEKLLQLLPADSYARGLALAALDRWDDAMPYLERTPPGMCEIFFWNPMWDRWRDDPRFGRLMEILHCTAEYKVARETQARMLGEKAANK